MSSLPRTAGKRFAETDLDFWLGRWDVTWDGGRGTNQISRILRDRVIFEDFREAPQADPGLHGQSWSVYDRKRHVWHQTWVDDQGSYLELESESVDGWFAFGRAAPEVGPDARQRMVFRDVRADGFRWTWELRIDAAAPWQLRWEIQYRRGDVTREESEYS